MKRPVPVESASALPRCSGAQSPSQGQEQEQTEAPASGPTSFIAAPGHISSHRGRASAPASYAKQFGVEAPSWQPKGAKVIFEGTPKQLLTAKNSLTNEYMRN